MPGNNPTYSGKLGTKRHILTDKQGIPLSITTSSANTHDIKVVIDVVDSTVIRRPLSKSINGKRGKRRRQHVCLDKGYNSAQEEQKLIKRGYVLHLPIKKKSKKGTNDEKEITRPTSTIKKCSPKRWVVDRTNS